METNVPPPPPTDPVFTNTPTQSAGNPNGAAPQGTPTPAGTVQTPTVASPHPEGTPDLDSRIASAVRTAIAPMEKFMGSVADHLQSQPAAPAAATGTPPEGEFWNEFTADPQKAIGSEFTKQAGPLIGQLADSHAQSNIERFATELDTQWGKGAYETIIKTDLDSIVKRALQQNPAAVLNREALRTTMDALVGRNVVGLAEHKQKAQATQGDTASKELSAAVQAELQRVGIDPTTLSGGIRRVQPTADKLPDDLHEYLAGKLRDTGVALDQKRAARMMNVGRSYSEWEKANAELEGK